MTTSRDYQERINRNSAEQQRIMGDSTMDGYEKASALSDLRQEQAQLVLLRNAARLAERGLGPRERVGVGY